MISAFTLKSTAYIVSASLVLSLISACCITPKPLCPEGTYQKAQCDIHELFSKQSPVGCEMDLCEALARGLNYNLSFRVKKVNAAIHAGQLKLAELSMLPELNGYWSIYSRNNDNTSFASDSNGNPTNIIINGSDRTIRTWRVAPRWSILDLGRGYLKAREESERVLIMEEESRRELQKLVQGIKIAYWQAYQAQELRCQLNQFQADYNETSRKINLALKDKILPKDTLLEYEYSLLDGKRRLHEFENKLTKAEQEFKLLINAPLDCCIILKKPPCFLSTVQSLRCVDFEKLDAITLVKRPELRGQAYQKRIAELGTRAAVIQALPNAILNVGSNFSSNSFLVNHFWNDSFIENSWNVMNLVSLPVALKTAETQIKYESLHLMELTLGALNETRIAYAHYRSLAKQCHLAKKQTENTKKVYTLAYHKEQSALASKNITLLTKLRFLTSKLDEVLLFSDLQGALGDLYAASGFDIIPPFAACARSDELLAIIESNLKLQDMTDFNCYVDSTYDELFKNEHPPA